MKIYFTRHGENDWNIKHSNQQINYTANNLPVTDDDFIEINSNGIKQVNKLAKKLKSVSIDLIICSSLPRAKQNSKWQRYTNNF